MNEYEWTTSRSISNVLARQCCGRFFAQMVADFHMMNHMQSLPPPQNGCDLGRLLKGNVDG